MTIMYAAIIHIIPAEPVLVLNELFVLILAKG